VVQTTLFPRSQIDVYLQVLQQDGSLLQACINGTTLALISAGIPLSDFVCAMSSGVHDISPMLDLTLLEENDIPNATVAVIPRKQKVLMVVTETRLHLDRFEDAFRLACQSGKVLHREMKDTFCRKSEGLVSAMNYTAGTDPGLGT
jgi:exosome complex component RRP41